MMNINKTLLEEIEFNLYDYDCKYDEIKHFMTHRKRFLNRQREAIRIIEGIMIKHGKEELLRQVVELARIEHGIRELEPWVRDHVVHALLSFILGIYINEKFFRPKIRRNINDFQWKLAGMFHDIGYPAQVAKDILEPFTRKINEIKKNLEISRPDIYFKVVPVGLEKLTNDINSFDLIQKYLNDWDLKINARDEFDNMINSGEICHGMISALAVLYVIDLMYQKYNPKREYKDIRAKRSNISWNQIYFERDIVSACSAIFIHNLPTKCFMDAKINRDKAPLAFLLRLSDSLQEWERPSMRNKSGCSSTKFDIKIDNDQLIFSADIDEDRKNEIKNDISSSLIAPDIQVH